MPALNTPLRRLAGVLLCAAACSAAAQRPRDAPAARIDDTASSFHGVRVPDPYRHLEQVQAPQTQAWMRAQSDATDRVLAGIDGREALRARLDEVTAGTGDVVRDVMRMPGERFYYLKRPRGERQFRLMMRTGLGGAERVLVDPEVESRASGVPHAINHYRPSWDGRYLAFGMSAGGSEDATLHVLDLRSGKRVGEPLPRVSVHAAQWLPDSRSFVATQQQELKPGQPDTDGYKNARVLWQRVGAKAAQARPVFGPDVHPALGLDPLDFGEITVMPGSRWMVARTTDTTLPEGRLFVAPLAQIGGARLRWQPISDAADGIVDIALRGDALYLLSRRDAPRKRLLKLDLREPLLERAVEVLPQPASGVLEGFQVRRDGIVAMLREGTAIALMHHASGGGTGQRIPLPEPGAAEPVDEPLGAQPRPLVWVSSWTRWPRLYALSLDGRAQPVAFGALPSLQPIEIDVTEVEVSSHDGVKVPMTVLHRRGLALDGRNPVLLSGYSAYGLSMTAGFWAGNLVWLERGGVLAYVSARGDGVHGDDWYRAGFKTTKPNTWKDGIAAARWLIARGYGSAATMGIKGSSAGGIFVGRAVTEAPELFAAAVFDVGSLDTVRAETTANGATNVSEFGTVADPVEFRALLEMSTYHQVRDGTPYPGVLLVHGVNDLRVEVWHSSKTAARLQAASTSGRPVLLRLDMQAGHGMGSTVDQRNAQEADVQSFLLWQMGKLQRKD